ncbi:KH domain-containing protein [Hutsoniella sourekii]|uniref:KH domain-containing protein n=1 Tax=Hutsoniella sourekii TaxID=87650 RepID=UPI00047F3F03|nr:KH domain-containing protein [Hutsoniella sourekii]
MPDIKALITEMVLPLIEFPDDFNIQSVEGDEFMEYHLDLNPEDIGRVIGRKGRVIRAIRTIVYSIRPRGQKRSRIIVNDAK